MCPNEISVTYLRSQQRDVFDDVLRGESFIIKRAGKSIAALINIDDYEAFSAWRREESGNGLASHGSQPRSRTAEEQEPFFRREGT